MFQAIVTRDHSPRALSNPRMLIWRQPITRLMMPNTGSTVCLRIYRSGLMPRPIALLLGGAGFCYLVNSFALLLAPDLAAALFPTVLLPAFVGEASLCCWMMFRGIDLERWRQMRRL